MSEVLLDIPQSDIDSFLDEILDFRKFSAKYLKIKDEEGNIIPFILNELQEYVLKEGKVLEKLDFIRNAPKGYIFSSEELIRLDILKCRQTGITTLFQAIDIWVSLIEENQKMLVLGHDSKSSTNMFDMFERYYENLPKPLQPELDTRQQGKILKYKNEKNILEVQTAGANVDSQKAGTGRSATYNYIHATECAFYPDYKTTFLGLLQASKKAKVIVRETTANGFNDYRDSWVDSKNGITDFIAIFLAWNKFESYKKPFKDIDDETKLMNDLGINPRYNSYTDEENNLILHHECSLEQLNWRRWAIDNLCQGEVDSFHQEYPTTDTEAFISSGRPVFDNRICINNFENAELPLKTGFLEYVKDDKGNILGVELQESKKGYWSIYRDIEIDEELEFNIFAGGGDISEGLAQGDRSIIKVLDRRSKIVCMTWSGLIDPDILGEEYHKLYLYLKKKVWINPEINSMGVSTLNAAYKLGVPMMYQQDFQQGVEITKDQIGTRTTGGYSGEQTKNFMITDLKGYIRENLFQDPEKEFWTECLTFVKDEKGKMGAQGKAKNPDTKTYDDRVMASAMMIRCHKWMPNYNKKVVENIPGWVKKLQKKNVKRTKFSV